MIDKITILEIKSERITDPDKLTSVCKELDLLRAEQNKLDPAPGLAALSKDLRGVNEQLWDIEDRIRDKEREKNFDDEFIQLARSVYQTNDRRAELKRQVNELLGSRIQEEKSYQPY